MTTIKVHKDDGEYDVTEAVRTMYDLLHSSMDWGSGFLAIEDVTEITRLAELCDFVNLEGAQEQLLAYMRAMDGYCPICKERYTFELGEPTPEGRIVRCWRWVHKRGAVGHAPGTYDKVWDTHTAVLIQPPHEPAYLKWPEQ